MTDFAVHRNGPAALPHDRVCCRHTESSAFTRSFGGEERFKQMRAGLFTHAYPAVCDRQRYVASRLEAEIGADQRAVQLYIVRFDGELSTLWHGVARVHHH